jgi:hypothetical protein
MCAAWGGASGSAQLGRHRPRQVIAHSSDRRERFSVSSSRRNSGWRSPTTSHPGVGRRPSPEFGRPNRRWPGESRIKAKLGLCRHGLELDQRCFKTGASAVVQSMD